MGRGASQERRREARVSKRVVFLASGRGSNFESFVEHVRLGVLKDVSIAGLVSNRSGAKALEVAGRALIPSFSIEGVSAKKFSTGEERARARAAFDEECISLVKKLNSDYVVLAGFDQILTKSFTDSFPSRILNIHPAYDTQRFGGKNMVGMKVHQSVIEQKAPYSGCTVHLVTSEVDEGPVIIKEKVTVFETDTPETLASRILVAEHLTFPKALQLLIDGRVMISDSENRCYVDAYSGNWDVEWKRRQESYIESVSSDGNRLDPSLPSRKNSLG